DLPRRILVVRCVPSGRILPPTWADRPGPGRSGSSDFVDISVRRLDIGEFPAFVRANRLAFGRHPSARDIEDEQALFEPARSLAAFDGERIVGTCGAFSLTLTVPGGTIPLAGVTQVGVVPTHRRRGILTALMCRQLD